MQSVAQIKKENNELQTSKTKGRIPANRGELLTNPLNPDPDFRLAIRMKSGLG